jgi:antitoxin HigA-1
MADNGDIAGRSGFQPSHPGRIVRAAAAALGVTQEQLADRVGVSRQAIHNILSGASAMTADMAARLGKALSISPALLVRMQAAHDTWEAERSPEVRRIAPFKARRGAIVRAASTGEFVMSRESREARPARREATTGQFVTAKKSRPTKLRRR